MKRIIFHWSGGSYNPNQTDLLHYHFLIDGDGNIHNGVYTVADNENCLDGVYAAHTGGGNTGSIGIAFCGMFGFTSKMSVGRFPLKQIQLEHGWELGAKLAHQYKLNLSDPMTIQTHYGFGQRNPKTDSHGKIDIIYLPSQPFVAKDDIEKLFRSKIKWYYNKIFSP